jgi:carbon starvation protein
MVLFVSTRRKGRSLAGIALDELGPTAGLATALAILYIIVIALAGLGIVVVKALGGEEVKMKAGTQIVMPADNNQINKTIQPGVAKIYDIPPGSRYQ